MVGTVRVGGVRNVPSSSETGNCSRKQSREVTPLRRLCELRSGSKSDAPEYTSGVPSSRVFVGDLALQLGCRHPTE